MKYLWVCLGWACVGLGIAGAFLPLLPTTPFLLLAAFSFSRGSTALHDWLLEHPQFGPPIHDWNNHRAIARRVKIYATVSMLGLIALSWLMDIPPWLLASQAGVMCIVGFFLWTHQEPPD